MQRPWMTPVGAVLLLGIWGASVGAVQVQPKAAPKSDDAPEYGPARGTLLIVGGNMRQGSGLAEKFIDLAGGPSGKFVIVPTNGGNRNPDGTLRIYTEKKVLADWKALGLTNVVMLHTADLKVESPPQKGLFARAGGQVSPRGWSSIATAGGPRSPSHTWAARRLQ